MKFYISKKFNRNLIDELNIDTDLSFGRLNFSKNFQYSKSII